MRLLRQARYEFLDRQDKIRSQVGKAGSLTRLFVARSVARLNADPIAMGSGTRYAFVLSALAVSCSDSAVRPETARHLHDVGHRRTPVRPVN